MKTELISLNAKRQLLSEFDESEIPKDEEILILWTRSVANERFRRVGVPHLVITANTDKSFIVTNEEFAEGRAEFRGMNEAD